MNLFFALAFTITRCVSIYDFASLVCIPIGITSFGTGLEIYAITTGIKMYKSIIQINIKKPGKIALLARSKWNRIEVLI